MMLGHCIENLSQAVAAGVNDSASWTYDFRFYSLQLLGVLLIWCGIRYLRATLKISRGEVEGRRMAWGNTLVILAIVVPLIPIQTLFAGLLTGLGIVTLLVLKLLKPVHISRLAGNAVGSAQ